LVHCLAARTTAEMAWSLVHCLAERTTTEMVWCLVQHWGRCLVATMIKVLADYLASDLDDHSDARTTKEMAWRLDQHWGHCSVETMILMKMAGYLASG
jgi:hypothetical protein